MLPRSERSDNRQDRSFDVQTTVAVALIAVLAISRIGDWLLEADQARMYFQAWGRFAGADLPSSYLERTSWLYLRGLSVLLGLGVSVETLPLVSSVLGAAAFIGLFLGTKKMTGGEHPLLLAVLYALVPGLGLISMNGYPTILAAAVAIVFAALAPETKRNVMLGGVALTLALLLKADIVLIFPGLLLWKVAQTSGPIRERLQMTATWMAAMVASFVPLVVVQRSRGRSSEFATSWSDSFPFTTDALSHPGNWANVAAPGLGTLLLVVIGVVVALAQRDGDGGGDGDGMRWVAAAVWIAGPVIFWGLIVGNSTRHVVPALPPIIWIASRALNDRRLTTQIGLLVVAGVLNIWPNLVLSNPPFDGNTWRSARAIDSAIGTSRSNTAELLMVHAAVPAVSVIDAADREYALFEFLVRHPDATVIESRSRAYGDEDYMVVTTFAIPSGQRVSFWYVPRGDFELFTQAMLERSHTSGLVWASSGTFKAPQLQTLPSGG